MVYHEVLVRVLCHHEQVRLRALAVRPRALGLGKFAVALRHRRVENVEALERVHRYQNRATNADVDLLACVPLADCVQECTLVEVTQHKQVADSVYDEKYACC